MRNYLNRDKNIYQNSIFPYHIVKVMKMKNVTIRLLGVGNSIFQPEVVIYDDSGCIVYSGCAYNGMVHVMLCCNKCYKVVVKSCLAQCITIIYIGKPTVYSINLNSCCQINRRIITFLLSDENYSNLPIEKGQVILWQRQ